MIQSDRRTALRSLTRFLAINFVLTVLFGYLYILFSPGGGGFLSHLFVHVALLSNFVPVYLIVALVLSVVLLAVPKRLVLFSLPPVVLSVLHILTFIDLAIFRLYHIHINSMVLNLVFTEGAGDVLHLGTMTLAGLGLFIVAIVLFEWLLIRRLHRRYGEVKLSRRRVWVIAVLLLVVVLADKSIYAVADLYNQRQVTRHAKLFPLYQRATVKRFMAKHFDFDVDREETLNVQMSGSGLDYPTEPLQPPDSARKLNVVWILMDAWRSDMLTSEVAPNVSEFAKRSLVFRNHYSGGNASRFGVFTLFYGVYGSYWHYFLGERRSPVIVDQLMNLGYDFHIVSATKLTNPEMRKTAFVRIPQDIEDELPGENAVQKDPELTDAFLSWLDVRDTTQPFFSFLFYDAPHGPAVYPDEFEKYTPAIRHPNFLTINETDAVPLRNAYKNAIGFDDYEVGRVLSALEERGLLENTVVLISGDHGEEFYESGAYGHTSSFSKQQTKVPLVLYIPGEQPREIDRLTSHLDVVPTVLGLLGYTTDPATYCQGHSLLDSESRDFVVVAGWDKFAVIDSVNTLVFSLEAYNASTVEVHDSAYKMIADDAILKRDRPRLVRVLRGLGQFLK